MALARRTHNRNAESFIWPGFVDALATLLMVIIFVLMVFFLIQINLAQRISGQDQTLNKLRGDLAELGALLNIERQEKDQLAQALKQSESQLQSLNREITALNDKIKAGETQINTLQTRLRDIIQERNAADIKVNASKKDILALQQSIETLRLKIGQLQALIDEKEEEARIAKEISVNLTKELNDALTSKVLELQRFRSEFFGRLRDILQNRADIKIVGDRFVFQSEVLFDPGSATIGIEGEKQLRELSRALTEITNSLPTDIDWVLQISGHTDNIPISTNRFRDNWDLSTERALSVVRYLILAGINPDRLSAAGFGEFHPVDTANTARAFAKNRRIEVKLTRR